MIHIVVIINSGKIWKLGLLLGSILQPLPPNPDRRYFFSDETRGFESH